MQGPSCQQVGRPGFRETTSSSEGDSYFFSTLTFWESQERPSKMPVARMCVNVLWSLWMVDDGRGWETYLPHSSRSWARLSTRGSWLFGRGRGLVLRRLVALLSLSHVSPLTHSLLSRHASNSPPSTSCLFANTSSTTFRISRSCMILPNSLFASSNLALSTLSMTKISA